MNLQPVSLTQAIVDIAFGIGLILMCFAMLMILNRLERERMARTTNGRPDRVFSIIFTREDAESVVKRRVSSAEWDEIRRRCRKEISIEDAGYEFERIVYDVTGEPMVEDSAGVSSGQLKGRTMNAVELAEIVKGERLPEGMEYGRWGDGTGFFRLWWNGNGYPVTVEHAERILCDWFAGQLTEMGAECGGLWDRARYKEHDSNATGVLVGANLIQTQSACGTMHFAYLLPYNDRGEFIHHEAVPQQETGRPCRPNRISALVTAVKAAREKRR